MAGGQDYKKRDANGNRLDFGGINTVTPVDAMPPRKFPFAQNVRRYLHDQIIGRATQAAATFTLAAAIMSLRRMNDTTADGPTSGYVLIVGAADKLYANAVQVASGLSGNRLSLVPFRPNTSPQPWMYVSDSSSAVAITASSFACAGMVKVRSDGLTYKTGIAEPQLPPTVTAQNAVVNGSVAVPATTRPWLVAGGQNPGYPYTATGGTAPVVIACAAGATIQVTATGTIVTSYSGAAAPGDLPPSMGQGTNYPGGQGNIGGSFCNVLMGAFTDSAGNVVTPTTGTGPVTIGAGPTTLLVPTGATQLQLGIDDVAYGSNTGNFNVSYTITTQAVASNVSLLGNVTAYCWGDSPTSGPVAAYIWKNPGDSGSGTPRSISNAVVTTLNNSLIFDDPNGGNQNAPMQWSTLDSQGNVTGFVPVFSAPLTGSPTNNFANFNMCVVGTLFIPAAGTYTFQIQSKDNVMWGIGGGATWSGKGTIRGVSGQTMTVVNKTALLPSPPINGGGSLPTSATVAVTFPASGDYSIELNYDYWYHANRSLVVFCLDNGALGPGAYILPLPQTVLQNVSYRMRWRSTATGARSNPSPPSVVNSTPVQTSTITPYEFNPDPQVDVADYFRQDSGLDNFTFVGTGPNTSPPTAFVDESVDVNVSGNEILEYDLFEPFPSIDLPHKGVVNAVGNTVTWVSGDKFNTRWLGGSLIKIGGVEYTLYNRPQSTTSLTVQDVNNGSGIAYEIDAATLAAQQTPSTWGPTEQGGFMFGTDPNNPGDIVWTNGQDPDSSADTNRYNLTSPSEPMMNGCIANGIPIAFSTERSWFIYPTFTSAAATVTGTQGSPFNPVLTGMTRGLYIRSCLTVIGGGLIAFRVKDGISLSEGGGGEESITDADLYNLFQHENFTPVTVTIAGFTIYPPDDTQPEAQALSQGNGYLYYDYVGTDGNPHTLVYDVAAKGWVWDAYEYPVTTHSLEEGKVNQTIVGCSDGSVRPLTSTAGVETATCVVLTQADNGGEARADKNLGDIFLKATVAATGPVTVQPYAGRYARALAGFSPTTLTGTGASKKYLMDFGSDPVEVDDIELALSWPAGEGTAVELWQPTWTDLPDTIQNRTTDWTNCGIPGQKLIQGLLLEANTFNAAKTFQVESDDDHVLYTPDEVPITYNGQQMKALTFTPPFLAHNIRLVASDGVPWQQFSIKPVVVPYPELVAEFQTQFTSHGQVGWNTIGEITLSHVSTADLTVTFQFDQWPTITLTIPNSGGVQLKGPKMPMPANKFKLVAYRVSSSQPFRLFQNQCEIKLGQWGRSDPYRIVCPFGGPSDDSAVV